MLTKLISRRKKEETKIALNCFNLILWKFSKTQFKSSALTSWYHKICILFMAVSSWLEDNDALKYSSDNFQKTKYLSQCIENCHSHIPLCCFSPIRGWRLWKVPKKEEKNKKKYLTNLCPFSLSFGTFSQWLENNKTS